MRDGGHRRLDCPSLRATRLTASHECTIFGVARILRPSEESLPHAVLAPRRRDGAGGRRGRRAAGGPARPVVVPRGGGAALGAGTGDLRPARGRLAGPERGPGGHLPHGAGGARQGGVARSRDPPLPARQAAHPRRELPRHHQQHLRGHGRLEAGAALQLHVHRPRPPAPHRPPRQRGREPPVPRQGRHLRGDFQRAPRRRGARRPGLPGDEPGLRREPHSAQGHQPARHHRRRPLAVPRGRRLGARPLRRRAPPRRHPDAGEAAAARLRRRPHPSVRH